MKTYVHLKTNTRFPEHGWYSGFDVKPEGRSKVFIKLGHPLCTKGWTTFKKKEWREEDIPDLAEPFTREQWLAYAEQYGDECAMEFLPCCDMMKPSEAYRMHHPPQGSEAWDNVDNQRWFRKVFKADLWSFIDRAMYGVGNMCSIDILKFEKHLAYAFKYPMHADGSMHDFMVKTFGETYTVRFCALFFPSAL